MSSTDRKYSVHDVIHSFTEQQQNQPKQEPIDALTCTLSDACNITNTSSMQIKIESVESLSTSNGLVYAADLFDPSIMSTDDVCYQSKTLGHLSNIQETKRWKILPKFPSENLNEIASSNLLLANVPCTYVYLNLMFFCFVFVFSFIIMLL